MKIQRHLKAKSSFLNTTDMISANHDIIKDNAASELNWNFKSTTSNKTILSSQKILMVDTQHIQTENTAKNTCDKIQLNYWNVIGCEWKHGKMVLKTKRFRDMLVQCSLVAWHAQEPLWSQSRLALLCLPTLCALLPSFPPTTPSDSYHRQSVHPDTAWAGAPVSYMSDSFSSTAVRLLNFGSPAQSPNGKAGFDKQYERADSKGQKE